MPNPDIGQLLDFDSQIESAVNTILVAGFGGIAPPLTPQVVQTRDSDTMVTPRIEIKFDVGPAILQYGAIGQANPKQVPVAYRGNLSLTIVSTRPFENAAMTPVHNTLVGFSRYFMSAGAKQFNDATLPWLQMLEMIPAQCGSQLQDHKEQDMDVLTWDVKFAVRNEFWPMLP